MLALLREGLTNEQLAERLGITERTAKFHVSEILSKLGVNSREEAAAWQPEERPRLPWRLAATAPLAFVWRKSSGGLNALGIVIGGAMVTAAIAGIVLLAVMLSRGGGSPGGLTSVKPRIAFSAGGSIYTVVPDGSDLRKVVPADRGWGNAAPALSPDGTKIAFTRDEDIWIADADGNQARKLAAVAELQTPPDGAASNWSLGAQSIAWSPDGKHIAYVLGRIGGSGVQELWVMNADGSGQKHLDSGGGVWEQPVWLDNDRVSIYVPGKVRVFNAATGAEEDAIPFAATGDFSFAAMPALPTNEDEWLVGPITAEGPITLGSANAGRKTVATGIAPALAPGGAAFAYFFGDTLHIAHVDGGADEQIFDLAPLGGRDRFFGEQPTCFPDSGPACSYRLPEISWAGSAEDTLHYLPALTYYDPAGAFQLKYPGAWVDFAPDLPFRPCSACTILGPAQAEYPYGIRLISEPLEPGCKPSCYDGAGRVEAGDLTHLTVAGQDASQMPMLHYPPPGLPDQTGAGTPYREIWTLVPLSAKALMIQAFYRDGDAVGERQTRAGYDVVLKSLTIGPSP